MSDRLKQIEARVELYSLADGAGADCRWLLAQLRGAEEEINKAIRLMCQLCGDGIPVYREAGRHGIVFWRHGVNGEIMDCDPDAGDVHERRYQRQSSAV